MATVNEQIATGRKFRKLIDEVNKIWLRISFWTKAIDVEFNDGNNAETKLGAINGVTDSLTSTASNIAASAKAVKTLNDKVTQLSSNLELKKEDIIQKHTYAGRAGFTYTFTENGIYVVSAAGSSAASSTPSFTTNANILYSKVVQASGNAGDPYNNVFLYIVKATSGQYVSGLGAFVAGCVVCKIK